MGCRKQCVCARVCTRVHVVFDHTPTRKRSLSSFLRICSCDVNKGQVLPPGRILKTLLVPRMLTWKNSPRHAHGMLGKAHITHTCVHRDRQRARRARWKDGHVGMQRQGVRCEKEAGSAAESVSWLLIEPIWWSDNNLHLISGHKTPDSWEAEKEKVQFNRFNARQNWVNCGFLSKTSPSQSLCISGFTSMSADESVGRPLPGTPVSAHTW